MDGIAIKGDSQFTKTQMDLLLKLYQNAPANSISVLVHIDQRAFLSMFYELGNVYSDKLQDKFNWIINTFQHYTQTFNPLKRSDRPAVVRKVIDTIFKEAFKTSTFKVSCKKGCAECCRMRVQMPESEARDIYNRVKDSDKVIWKRAELQKGLGEKQYSTHLLGDNNKCMFLADDNTCSIYDIRPCVCRMYLVATPPSMCCMDLSKDPPKVACVDNLSASLIYSGFCAATGETIGSLPDFMLKFRSEDM